MDSEKGLIGLRQVILIFLLYFAVAFAVHHPGFHSAMMYDAEAWIEGKANVFAREDPIEVLRIVPARPLFMMSLYANYKLAGMDPYFFRVCNAAILGAAAAALMLLVLLIFSRSGRHDPRTHDRKLAVGIFVGLLFCVHPLQNFVVLYIWQREAILACFFYFSALGAYVALRSGRMPRRAAGLALIGALFFAGLLTKENVITLPLTLILAELILFKQNRKQLVERALSIGAITLPPFLVYLFLTWSLHGTDSQHPEGTVNRLLTYYSLSGLTLWQVVLTESRVFFSYLLTILAPFWETPQLVRAEVVSVSLWKPPITAAACAGVIILVYLAIKYRRERPVEAFGTIFYFVALLPESLLIPQFLFFGYRPILSMAGVLMILGRVVLSLLERDYARNGSAGETPVSNPEARGTLVRRFSPEIHHRYRAYRLPIVGACLFLVLLLGFQTFRQAARWNPFDFWRNAYNSLPSFSEQVEPKPYWDVLVNFGAVLLRSGKYLEAVEVLKQAAALSPELETLMAILEGEPGGAERSTNPATSSRGPASPGIKVPANLLVNLGLALKRSGKLPEAIIIYRKALEKDPTSAMAHNNLGLALQESGNTMLALEHYGRALALKQDFPEACYNLGNSLRQTGDLARSEENLRKALALKPNYAQAIESLGYTLLMSGQFADAVVSFRRILAADSRNPNMHNAMGIALAEQGQIEQARAHFKAALDIDPGHAEARHNLAALPANPGP